MKQKENIKNLEATALWLSGRGKKKPSPEKAGNQKPKASGTKYKVIPYLLLRGACSVAVAITIIKLPLCSSVRDMPAPIYLQYLTNHRLSLAGRGTAKVQYLPPGDGSAVVLNGGLPMP